MTRVKSKIRINIDLQKEAITEADKRAEQQRRARKHVLEMILEGELLK